MFNFIVRHVYFIRFDSALTSFAFQEYHAKEVRNRVLNRIVMPIGASWSQHKLFATEKQGIQPVDTSIRVL
jgi:hypothetical protein